MRCIRAAATAGIVLFLLSCTTAHSVFPFTDKGDLSGMKWSIGFEYEIGPGGYNEENRTHLKLLEDIYYGLLEQGIDISKEPEEGRSLIKLHTVYQSFFKSADINFYSPQGEILARVTVTNDNSFFFEAKKNHKFTAYCVETVLAVLAKPE